MFFYSTLAAFLLFSGSLAAQPGYRIEKYDLRHGLHSNWVAEVQQDAAGFIWLAHEEGTLSRFDGRTFKHFSMNDAERRLFGGNSISNFIIDEQNRFYAWVNARPARFDPATGRFELLDPTQAGKAYPALLPDWEKWRILWEEWKVDKAKNEFTSVRTGFRFALDLGIHVYHVLETPEAVWVATFQGLIKITPQRKLFETVFSKPFTENSLPVQPFPVYGMTEAAGWLWLPGDFSVLRTPLLNPGVMEKIASKDGLGTGRQIFADSKGRIWPGGFNASSISAEVAQTQYHNYEMPRPFSFVELPNGKIWAATSVGIFEINIKAGNSTPVASDTIQTARVLHPSKNSVVWAGTEEGLFCLAPKKNGGGYEVAGHFHPDNTPGFGASKILSINEKDGYLWLGSDGGLIRFNHQSPITNHQSLTRTFTTADGLPNNKIYFALPDDLGYLWCGTDWGLARVSLASVMKDEGLPEIRTFHTDDGLPHEEFNTLAYFKSPTSGKIYLGGLNGMVIFSPKDFESQAVAKTQLVFTSFEKYDRQHDSTLVFDLSSEAVSSEGVTSSYPLTSPIVLEHYDQFFTIRFALLAYANPSLNRYRYRLDGFEKDWNEAGNLNFARYSALPPGSYTFRVRAADHNGNWSSTELSLPIFVKRAWYKSWWAFALYLLAAASIGYAIYRERLRRAQMAANLQLEQAKAQHLQSLDAFKSRFFTNITHEFRTPLTVILGMAERLRVDGGRLTEREAKGNLSLIKRNGESLLRLINQLLDLAKLEDNSLKMNYVHGDVLPWLRYVVESLHSLANVQNVLVRLESKEAEINMDYDPERLLSIVYNLLSNAIKFTPSGGRVTLSAVSTSSADSTWLTLKVSDTGVGIPPEDLPYVFDRFFQAHNTAVSTQGANSSRGNTGGTGIGLALTRELIKAMGGEISVQSEVGKGTTFTVRLPITKNAPATSCVPAANDGVTSSHAVISAAPPQILESSSPQILLIEDNPDVVEYLAACLGENYRLDFAYNGRAGIEKALEIVPDLIVSDVMMPEKDGFEVCDFLKNDERTSHVPIVLLTAKADMESRIAGLKRGADAYLAKPFHQEELLVTLANLLALRRKLQLRYAEISLGKAAEAPATRLPVDPPNGLFPTESVAGQQVKPGAVPAVEAAIETAIEDEFLLKVRAVVEEQLSNSDLDAELICRKIGMGHTNLNLKMNALTGMPVTKYIRSLRLRRAKDLLGSSQMNVSEIAYEVGFTDPKYFSRVFSEEFGAAPGDWRRKEG